MDDKELRELFEVAQNGNDDALSKLLEIFKPVIVKNSMIDGRFDEDCFQELIVKFIECIKNFKFDGKIDIDSFVKNTD